MDGFALNYAEHQSARAIARLELLLLLKQSAYFSGHLVFNTLHVTLDLPIKHIWEAAQLNRTEPKYFSSQTNEKTKLQYWGQKLNIIEALLNHT